VRRWFEWLTAQQHPRCIFGMGDRWGLPSCCNP
jgi:hypothetical protein